MVRDDPDESDKLLIAAWMDVNFPVPFASTVIGLDEAFVCAKRFILQILSSTSNTCCIKCQSNFCFVLINR